MKKNIAIIGGGAAGFFAAINVKENFPNYKVSIFEKSNKTLSKVKVSGGGRCNVTNACEHISAFSKAYPRGEKQMKKLLQNFSNIDLIEWFKKRNVQLKTEADGRMFPVSNNSQTIIDCFLELCKKYNIQILLKKKVNQIIVTEQFVELLIENQIINFDKVIVATGGANKIESYNWLQNLNLKIDKPIPSLFTFNMPTEAVKKLQGVVVENAQVKIQKTKFVNSGPLLITHWGMSGPSILKLSAFAAKALFECNYNFNISVSWIGETNNHTIENDLLTAFKNNPKKQIVNVNVFNFPKRFWHFILEKCNIPFEKLISEIGKKDMNKLINAISNDIYKVEGKTTFKEEFVTCGGINLNEIDFNKMASKKHSNIYFAGEILNIDGITGGYNFQAAWSGAFLAAQLK